MHSEFDLTVTELHEPGFHVESAPGAHAHFSALQMFATSLGLCTGSVLVGYGAALSVSTEQLSLRIRWTVAASPNRIDSIDMEIDWPGLPESRRAAAERAAGACTIHNTLHHQPTVRTSVGKRAG